MSDRPPGQPRNDEPHGQLAGHDTGATRQLRNRAVQRKLEAWLTRLSPTEPPAPDTAVTLTSEDCEHIEMLLKLQDLRSWSLIDEDGPVWFRGFARWDEDEGLPHAQSLTERYGVARIVVGHTIPATRLITPRFDDQVFLIDTGMLIGCYSGRVSALEIEGSWLTAVYLDRRIQLAQQSHSSLCTEGLMLRAD